MNTSEVWRDVPSIPTLQCSSHGRVRSTRYEQRMPRGGCRYRQLSPTSGVWDGDRFIVRFRGSTYRVARLVCEAFHGPASADLPVCMHLDENSRNNRPDNLQWGTQKENLNAPGFIAHCKRRTGQHSQTAKGRARKSRCRATAPP